MKISPNDWVLVNPLKPELAQVVTGSPLTVILERDRGSERVSPVQLEPHDVVCNFGVSPRPGTAYGAKIEPLWRTLNSKMWGTIKLYVDLTGPELRALKSGLNEFRALMEHHNLSVRAGLEVRAMQGKYQGFYKHLPNDLDVLCIRPGPDLDLTYILSHELSHGIWYQQMPKRWRHKWVQLYHESVQVWALDSAELSDIRVEIEEQQSIKEYLAQTDSDTQYIVRCALTRIRTLHGLDTSHLELMLGAQQSLDQVWPLHLEYSDRKLIITDYAKKSPEEYWAEALAHYLCKKVLPPPVLTLVGETLRSLVKTG